MPDLDRIPLPESKSQKVMGCLPVLHCCSRKCGPARLGIDEGGMRFQIVSPHEMDLEAGKISLKSPIGAALRGKKVGEIAEARVPSGTLRLRIESITLDEG